MKVHVLELVGSDARVDADAEPMSMRARLAEESRAATHDTVRGELNVFKCCWRVKRIRTMYGFCEIQATVQYTKETSYQSARANVRVIVICRNILSLKNHNILEIIVFEY